MRDSSGGRAQTITITDGSGSTLDSARTVTGFTSGVYYRYTFSGTIKVQIDLTGGANVLLQGLFFDAVAGGGSFNAARARNTNKVIRGVG